MQSKSVSDNCTAIALGMGLGEIESLKLEEILQLNIPKVLDADIFYNPLIVKYLDENVSFNSTSKRVYISFKTNKYC